MTGFQIWAFNFSQFPHASGRFCNIKLWSVSHTGCGTAVINFVITLGNHFWRGDGRRRERVSHTRGRTWVSQIGVYLGLVTPIDYAIIVASTFNVQGVYHPCATYWYPHLSKHVASMKMVISKFTVFDNGFISYVLTFWQLDFYT